MTYNQQTRRAASDWLQADDTHVFEHAFMLDYGGV